MKILVFGQNGQVASELAQFEETICMGRSKADLTQPELCAKIISEGHFYAVINAAAYTAVDKAEEEESLANLINGDAPKAIAEACTQKGIPMVHISTDYVFSGTGNKPWEPDNPTAPPNAYGRSKLRGEIGVQNSGGNTAILRTSWVFSSHGNNFVKTMLRLGKERAELNIVNDQIGGPTAAHDIAQACYKIVNELARDPNNSGIYHFSGAPDCSWAEFASEIFFQSNIQCAVNGIPTAQYPTPAKRPLNSRLDCSSLETTFGIKRPNWKQSLSQVLENLS